MEEGGACVSLTVPMPLFSAYAAHLACHGDYRHALPGFRGTKVHVLYRPNHTHSHVEGQTYHCDRLYIKEKRLKYKEEERKRGDLEMVIVWVHIRSQRREIRQSDTCHYALH